MKTEDGHGQVFLMERIEPLFGLKRGSVGRKVC